MLRSIDDFYVGALVIAGVLIVMDFFHITAIPICTAAPLTWRRSFAMATLTVETFCARMNGNLRCVIEGIEIPLVIFDPSLWAGA
mmetsp:Transcript_24707/g.40396  ORF Transcript_24707/g.40396 Transcript_24707/m.40396 type:complete len:85 (-) Transcript_24707:179-433(-)